MVIQHNISAMNGQRQLNIVGVQKNKSAEKLSSGYKINRSADDAAGLSISEKMRSQIRGLDQGGRNTQDGISLLQVADGALSEVHDMIHRINELAIQAANDTNSTEDRDDIQKEINELVKEIDRISDTTEFNTIPLFQGGTPKSTPSRENKTPLPDENTRKIINDTVRSSLTLSGTPSGITEGVHTINADTSGITIDGDVVNWSDVKTALNDSLTDTPIVAGDYSFSFKGLNIGFSVPDNATLDDVCNAINKASFTVNRTSTPVKAVELSSYTIDGGSYSESILSNYAPWSLPKKFASITADSNGVNVTRGSSTSSITWAEIGLNDISNAGGKTFSLHDNDSGIRINGKIADDSTADDIIRAFNSTSFSYDVKGYKYVNREWINQGYYASDIENVPNSSTCYSLKNPYLSSFRVYGVNIYEKLGYTRRQDMLQDLNVSVTLMDDDEGNPMARITDKATGRYYDEHFECIDPSTLDRLSWTGKFKFATGGNGAGATLYVYAGKNSDESLEFDPEKVNNVLDWLGTLGTIASNVTISSPYALYYSVNNSYKVNYTAGTIKGYEESQSGNDDNLSPDSNVSPANEKLELWIQSGATAGNGMFISVGKMNSHILGLDALGVSSYNEAQKVIEKAGNATTILSEMRSRIGVQQNRLEHTYNNTENTSENTQATESRIRDTDMASEMVKFSKKSILAQAGQSMLAQSNQSRQGILSLLQ